MRLHVEIAIPAMNTHAILPLITLLWEESQLVASLSLSLSLSISSLITISYITILVLEETQSKPGYPTRKDLND